MLRNDLYKPWFADKNQWGFEILSGDYQGLVVQLENIDMIEEAKKGIGVNYHIIHKPDIVSKDMMKSEILNQTFDLIINDILTEAMQIDVNRNNNTEESNPQ